MNAQTIKLSKLRSNTGQIEGLPKNPRVLRDDKFNKLVQSVKDDPEMLELRELIVMPVGKEFVVIAGNMRLKVLKSLGHKEAPCKVLDPSTPVEKLRAYTIKDNIGFGEHDWDALANEWDAGELSEWGLDLPLDFGAGDNEGLTDPDEAPEVAEFARCTLGDRWTLGDHLLIVGSSIDEAVREEITGQPFVTVLDPPYELKEKDWKKWITDPCIFFGVGKSLTLIPHDLYRFERIIHKTYKNRGPLTQVAMRHAIVVQVGSDKHCPKTKESFDSIAMQEADKVHRHQKPATLIADHLKGWTPKGLTVVDPFAGSGTSFIAGELSGRKVIGVELDTATADIAIERWEKYTGKSAIKNDKC